MKKEKLLLILHYSPPLHGASKIGDFIKNSERIKQFFTTRYVKLVSSETLGEIGLFNVKKIVLFISLFFHILIELIHFRPNKIYYTASPSGIAFYRDLINSILLKLYKSLTGATLYFHYQARGIKAFTSQSSIALYLTRLFLNDTNIILLSATLQTELSHIHNYRNLFFIPNCAETILSDSEFEEYIQKKDFAFCPARILYLSNMIKEKGYWEVLELAKKLKDEGLDNVQFDFAGGWQCQKDQDEFLNYIARHGLEKITRYHGVAIGERKKQLFQQAHLFVFPTLYAKETFGIVVIEAFSYGVPVISTSVGALKEIVDATSGVSIDNPAELYDALMGALKTHVNLETARYCRERFLSRYTLEQFERNFIQTLSKG
jgi:glycosyltransferase involved in cell wall biosynthesis